MTKVAIIFVVICLVGLGVQGQIDPALLKRVLKDTPNKAMNMDAVYSRPFVAVGKLPV